MTAATPNDWPDHPARHANLDTPALVLDLDALEQNVRTMAGHAQARGIGLRPHAKTHKSVEIGRLQLAAGAVGLCCAKLGEAEALADAGLAPLLITSPMVGDRKLDRLMALHEISAGIAVVVDDPNNLGVLAERAASATRPLPVLVDLDAGLHRTGATTVQGAVRLAHMIMDASALQFRGVQAYAGHVQHIEEFATRKREAAGAAEHIRSVVTALNEDSIFCEIVTGGGTGTFDIDPGFHLFTDLQVGSYVFSDVEYDAVALGQSDPHPFQNALFVLAQVVSANHAGFVTIDAGSKTFSMDGPAPQIVAPGAGELVYEPFGDEFGKVSSPAGSVRLAAGDRVLCVVPHCDPTINMHDAYVCVRGDTVIDTWSIQARGAAA